MADAPRIGAEPVASPAQLRDAARRVAAAIGADHPDGVTLVGSLKDSVVFLADLARHLRVPARIEFVAVTPFDGAARQAHVVKDVDEAICGEAVVLVTGIVDTGLSVDFLVRHLAGQEPASVRIATLVDKAARRLLPIVPDYTAVVAPDRFLVGYGLDYAGRYRNVPGLWAVDRADLAIDPDHFVAALYPVTGPHGKPGARAGHGP